jgi:hypothetical protein
MLSTLCPERSIVTCVTCYERFPGQNMPQFDSVAKLQRCNSIHFVIEMVSIRLPEPRAYAANITRRLEKIVRILPVKDWTSSVMLLGH